MKYSTLKVAVVGCVAGAALASSGAALASSAPAPIAIRLDDRAGLRDSPAVTATGLRPDDRAGPRGAGVMVLSTSVRPDDRAGFRGAGREPSEIAVSTPHSVPSTGNGFDWSAAGVGAGAAAAVVLLFGCALTLRRSHRRVEASA
jgi:hypothetical protein